VIAALPAALLLAQLSGASQLASWMEGRFTGTEPRADGSSRALTMVVVPVPKSRLGEQVLYLELAEASTPNQPFRQRFLRLEEPGAGKVMVRVFEPQVPLAVSGKWRDAADLAVFSARDVMERAGCLLTLRRSDDGRSFVGGTDGAGCPSQLAGARYMTERVSIAQDRFELTHQGFDAAGHRVWGSEWPIRFALSPLAPPPTATPTPAPTTAPATPTASPTPRPVVTAAAAVSPTATAVPEKPAAPAFPSSVLTPVLTVTGLGGEPRTLSVAELKALRIVELRGERPVYRGPTLLAVLERCGLAPDAPGARRLLAAAVVVARSADGATAVFSAEELQLAGAPIVAIGTHGGALDSKEGPFKLVAPGSPARSLGRLVSLELRLLAENAP